MGLVYSEIKVTNAIDFEMAKKHIIGEDEIKYMYVNFLVDSGAYMLNINERLQEILQLPFVQRRVGETADGRRIEMDVVGPVRLEFKDRICNCNAMVLPDDNEPLLGAIPMEEMDLVIIPQRQILAINPEHPDYAVMKLK